MTSQSVRESGFLVGEASVLDAQIVSGLRWTFWLSALSVPFSLATSIILARTGPEVIGTFGLLQVYIGVVSVFLFFGGNAVPIRFLPRLNSREHFSFLGSYFFVVLAFVIPWLVVVTLWPQGLHYLFGEAGGTSFQLLILYLSPLFILFSLVGAALKGLMEIKWAQLLNRMVTVGSFAVYTILFFFFRAQLEAHYTGLIWGIYLSLVFLGATIGLWRIARLSRWRLSDLRFRFTLPPTFWRYALSLQGSSVMSFLITRLDYLLVLNLGGLEVLGQYVALMTIAMVVSRVAQFFWDSLLPSLSNTIAQRDWAEAGKLARTYLRLVVPINLALACAILFYAPSVVRLLGPEYEKLTFLIQLAVPFAAIQSLTGMLSNILNACGRADWNAVAKISRLVVYLALFWPLWVSYGLLGAVLAWGLSELLMHSVSIYLVQRKAGFRLALARMNGGLVGVLAISSLVAVNFPGLSQWPGLVLSAGIVTAYLWGAAYSLAEIRRLVRLMLPAGRHSPSDGVVAVDLGE